MHSIGLLGHSEGAIVAPIVAAAHPNDVAFIVLMAGSGVPGDQIIVEQTRLIAEANGASAEEAQIGAAQQRALLDVVKKGGDDTAMEAELRAMLKGKVPDAALASTIAQAMSPWFWTFILRMTAIETSSSGGLLPVNRRHSPTIVSTSDAAEERGLQPAMASM